MSRFRELIERAYRAGYRQAERVEHAARMARAGRYEGLPCGVDYQAPVYAQREEKTEHETGRVLWATEADVAAAAREMHRQDDSDSECAWLPDVYEEAARRVLAAAGVQINEAASASDPAPLHLEDQTTGESHA